MKNPDTKKELVGLLTFYYYFLDRVECIQEELKKSSSAFRDPASNVDGLEANLHLINTGTNALTVKTGALIGQYSPVTEVESLPEEKDYSKVNRMKEARPPELPAHLKSYQKQWSEHLPEE